MTAESEYGCFIGGDVGRDGYIQVVEGGEGDADVPRSGCSDFLLDVLLKGKGHPMLSVGHGELIGFVVFRLAVDCHIADQTALEALFQFRIAGCVQTAASAGQKQ